MQNVRLNARAVDSKSRNHNPPRVSFLGEDASSTQMAAARAELSAAASLEKQVRRLFSQRERESTP